MDLTLPGRPPPPARSPPSKHIHSPSSLPITAQQLNALVTTMAPPPQPPAPAPRCASVRPPALPPPATRRAHGPWSQTEEIACPSAVQGGLVRCSRRHSRLGADHWAQCIQLVPPTMMRRMRQPPAGATVQGPRARARGDVASRWAEFGPAAVAPSQSRGVAAGARLEEDHIEDAPRGARPLEAQTIVAASSRPRPPLFPPAY